MLSLPLTQAVFSLCPVTSDSEEGLYAAVKCIPDKTGGTMQHPIGKNDPDIFSSAKENQYRRNKPTSNKKNFTHNVKQLLN